MFEYLIGAKWFLKYVFKSNPNISYIKMLLIRWNGMHKCLNRISMLYLQRCDHTISEASQSAELKILIALNI